jgi:hypothetical protein
VAPVRDYRGIVAIVIAIGIQFNLFFLIFTETSGPPQEHTLMATIFGGALASLGGYMVGSRPQAQNVVDEDPAVAAATAAPADTTSTGSRPSASRPDVPHGHTQPHTPSHHTQPHTPSHASTHVTAHTPTAPPRPTTTTTTSSDPVRWPSEFPRSAGSGA